MVELHGQRKILAELEDSFEKLRENQDGGSGKGEWARALGSGS